MLRAYILPLILLFVLPEAGNPTEEVNQFWKEVSRTVSEGDFENYAATYHSDAILVDGISGTSYPIADALAGWEQGFEDTRTGKIKATVQFKFTERYHSKTTAHDTGIFKYSSQAAGEESRAAYIHFQGLLNKVSGEWKLMMEYQVSVATEEEWSSIK